MFGSGLMAAVRFRDGEVRRDCCDLAHMRRRWGADTARLISHRLQQLEAIASIDDLALLPFDSRRVNGGIEVAVGDGVVLLLEIPQPRTGEPHAMDTIVVSSVRTSTSARKA